MNRIKQNCHAKLHSIKSLLQKPEHLSSPIKQTMFNNDLGCRVRPAGNRIAQIELIQPWQILYWLRWSCVGRAPDELFLHQGQAPEGADIQLEKLYQSLQHRLPLRVPLRQTLSTLALFACLQVKYIQMLHTRDMLFSTFSTLVHTKGYIFLHLPSDYQRIIIIFAFKRPSTETCFLPPDTYTFKNNSHKT